jgi:hypothetical protein
MLQRQYLQSIRQLTKSQSFHFCDFCSMMEEILPLVGDDEEFFFKHACVTLEKHDGGMPRARVFVHALWAVSTPEQWSKRKKFVKGGLAKSTWKEIEGLTEVPQETSCCC